MEFQNVPHLLILAPNWLGDAVMALPAIADVARALPATRIAVAARPSVAPLFTMVPDVHDVVTLDSRSVRLVRLPPSRLRRFRLRQGYGETRQSLLMSRATAVGASRRSSLDSPASVGGKPDTTFGNTFGNTTFGNHRYDAALLLPNSFQAALAVWRSGIPERWGHRTDWRGALLTRAVLPPGDHVHQAAYYQHLTSGLGFPSGPLEPRVEPSVAGRRAGDELLAAAGWDGRTPLVALAPGAAYGGAKRWPAQSFAELAVALERDGVKSVLVGGAADASGGAEVVELVRGMGVARVLNLIGRTDLPALAGVLVRCRALVSNDSGAMHLGAALGVAVTAMFGPTDEAITRPLGRPDAQAPVVISHDVWCRPCLLRECPLTHACMRGISVEAVRGSVTV